jgi:sigma-70-like protein
VDEIYAMCGNLIEAQDCVQEAFIRAWDRRRSLDLDQAPEALGADGRLLSCGEPVATGGDPDSGLPETSGFR